MSDAVPESVVDAEAEVAAAEAKLAAAEAAQAPTESPAPPAATTTVHLASARPWNEFDPGDGLPLVTWDGTDVDATVAEMIEAKAAAAGFPLRKD